MVGSVKALYLALLSFSLCLTVVGADKKPLTKEESAKVIEGAIRKSLNKPTGELTKADLEKVRKLGLLYTAITDAGLKEVAKLKQLKVLGLLNTRITDVGLNELTAPTTRLR